MKRCFVLGAGFSTAVAGLPLMKDMVRRFNRILGEARRDDERLIRYGKCIQWTLWELEKRWLCWSPDAKVVESNVDENLEVILSMIDLNQLSDIHGLIEEKGERADVSARGVIPGVHVLDLRHALESYIYLALDRPDEIKKQLLHDFVAGVQDGEAIVTFNYDLVLDRALYDSGRWKPQDGYGIEFRDFPAIARSHEGQSRVFIYKLHGSLNWHAGGWYGPLHLVWFRGSDGLNTEKAAPIFPGYVDDGTPGLKPCLERMPRLWLLPSFVKLFENPDLMKVWQRAAEALRDADEVVFVGYSLPKADSAACVLFGTSDLREKSTKVVDSPELGDDEADELASRYKAVIGKRPDVTRGLDAYLSAALWR